MNSVEYVKELPRINLTNKYIILETYKNNFHALYDKAIRQFMPTLLEKKSLKLDQSNKVSKILQNSRWEDLKYYPRIREALITGPYVHFKNFGDWNDYFTYIDSKDSFPIFFGSPEKQRSHYGPAPFNLVCEFIIPLMRKGILLAPVYNANLLYTKSSLLFQITSNAYSDDLRYIKLKKAIKFHFSTSTIRTFAFYLVLFSITISPEEITENDLDDILNFYNNNDLNISKTIKKTNLEHRKTNLKSYTFLTLFKLRHLFVKLGAHISTTSKQRLDKHTVDDYLVSLYKEIGTKQYKNNKFLIELAINHFKQLYLVDRVSKHTLKGKASILRKFFSLLLEQYQYNKISTEMMSKFLDYPKNDTCTYQHKLKLLEAEGVSNSYLNRTQGIVMDFLNSTKEYYGCFKENTKVRFRHTGASLFRESLDEEVYETMLDILINRPPNIIELKKWGSAECDWSSWWPHKVVPFLPLSILLHLHLPLRSSHILNLDRDSFLLKNSDGSIRGYYINTDKDTSRKDNYIIPNIYKDSLRIFENLIELNKQMYPNLKKVTYNHDKNTPWEKFYPLFPNYDGDDAMNRTTYEKYFKIVVLNAQLELYQKGSHIKIAWLKNTNSFPLSREAISLISSQDIQKKVKLSFGLHSLRVTGATRLLRMGLPPQIIKLFTGHKDLTTLINIYLKIPHEELIQKYFQLHDSIDTSSLDGLKKDHKNIPKILNNYIKSSNPKEVEAELNKNYFFSLPRMIIDNRHTTNTRTEQSNGVEELSKIHWTHWKSYSYGICGKPDTCPIGAENRCSLCAYFVTSPLYSHGIITKCEQVQKRIFMQSNIIAQNRLNNVHEENRAFHKQQLLDIEELSGWYEIIEKIEETVAYHSTGTNLPSKNYRQPLVSFKVVPKMQGLIQIYQRAKKLNINNPDTQDTIFQLSSQIIRWCMNNNCIQEIQDYLDSPNQIIEWFLPNYYIEHQKETFLPDFCK